MATGSDFAQKVLHDLRLRKEKMATTQNSSQVLREPTEFHANAATYRDAQLVTAPESGRRPNRGSKSFDISESSNQIILKNSSQFTDLSMASLSFSAFENSQKLSKISPPRNNPLLNFFTRLSRGPMSCKKTDIDQNHITEISTGIEKLNQILQSCSNNNHSFNRNSTDLEESLRMLVNLQEAADYINGTSLETRLRLLEQNKDDHESLELNRANNRLLVEPPKFSFDKPSKSSKHKRSASCIPDFDSTRKVKVKNEKGSSEKGRISNVIAKLMGLEELPHKEENMHMQKDLLRSKGINEGKERKVLSNIKTYVKDPNPGIKAEKREENGVDGYKMVKSERRQMQKDLKLFEIPNSKGSEKRLTLKEDKERKITEVNNEMKQKVQQDSMIFLAEDITTHEKIEYKEKRNAKKGLKQKQKDGYAPRAQVPKRRDGSEEVHQAGQKGKKKHEDHQVESLILSKARQKNDKAIPENGKSMKANGEAAMTNDDPMIKKGQNENSSPRKQLKDIENKSIDISSAIKNKAVSKENQKNENTRKKDLQMIRKSTDNVDRLTRSLKQSADMLHDLKQQMQKKRKDEQSERAEMSTLKSDAVIEITKKDEPRDERQTKNTQKVLAPKNNCYDIDSTSRKVSGDLQKVEGPCSSMVEQEIKQSDLSSEQLTEPQRELKEIVIKSQEFLNTAKALFKLNIPLTFLHTGDDHINKLNDKKLILDCAYEVMKRKAKRTEHILFHTCKKITTLTSPRLRSLDDLIKLLSKDLETLMFHDDEGDIVGYLCNLLENDVYDKVPDANCMWDFEWGDMMLMFSEKDDVVRDLEKHVLNVLLDEITNDLLEVVI